MFEAALQSAQVFLAGRERAKTNVVTVVNEPLASTSPVIDHSTAWLVLLLVALLVFVVLLALFFFVSDVSSAKRSPSAERLFSVLPSCSKDSWPQLPECSGEHHPEATQTQTTHTQFLPSTC